MGFRFVEQADFANMTTKRTLTPGFWYFITGGNVFHIAFTEDTYGTYSGVDVKQLVDELLEKIDIDNDYLYQMITDQILVSPNFIKSIAEYLIDYDDNSVVQQIANYILEDESVMQHISNQLQTIISQIISNVVSINAPDGSVLATNDDGVFTLPLATNETYGIVKGQENTTPETWNNVSVAPDGTMSVNRELLEEKIGQGGGSGGADKWDRMVAEPDKSVIAKIENRELIVQATSPHQYGVVKCGKDCVCYRKPLGLKSMDGMLVAVLKHDEHLFYPMVFIDRLPPRLKLFDKLTFIAPGSGTTTGGGGSNSSGGSNISTKDFTQNFSAHAYIPNPTEDFMQDFPANGYVFNPTEDFIEDFPVNAYVPNSTKDYTKNFPVNVFDSAKDFIQDFAANAYTPNSTEDFTHDFSVSILNPTKDFIQDFSASAYVPDALQDFIQDFPASAYVPNSTEDFTKNFPVSVFDSAKDFIQDFTVNALPSLEGSYILSVDFEGSISNTTSKYLTDSQARDTWTIEVFHNGTAQGGTPANVQATTGYVMYSVVCFGGGITITCSNSNGMISFNLTIAGSSIIGATIPIKVGLLKL